MKIFIDESRGSAYRLEGEEVAFAPLCMDGTFDFEEEGGIVDVWDDSGNEEKAKAEEARIRAALA